MWWLLLCIATFLVPVYPVILCAKKKPAGSGMKLSKEKPKAKAPNSRLKPVSGALPSPSAADKPPTVVPSPADGTPAGGAKNDPAAANLESPEANGKVAEKGAEEGSKKEEKGPNPTSNMAPTQPSSAAELTAAEKKALEATQKSETASAPAAGKSKQKKGNIVENSTEDTLKHVESIRDVVAREGEM